MCNCSYDFFCDSFFGACQSCQLCRDGLPDQNCVQCPAETDTGIDIRIVIGAVIGCVVVISSILSLIYFIRKRCWKRSTENTEDPENGKTSSYANPIQEADASLNLFEDQLVAGNNSPGQEKHRSDKQ
ncbi:uncharacterized protein LOC102810318 [Saccoglossus kowalevskii]|uniref:Uncharacterized protein LOC102810318 n=1 Tax=Saccoglossus kowalevskii TaxID=10224 RepID=A0ABM0MHS5_SACKO|nr:PREDICTED: uncharacterized protein LOC102810318 [Saccoglossus kowalevskii]